jgi:hypothetical protein
MGHVTDLATVLRLTQLGVNVGRAPTRRDRLKCLLSGGQEIVSVHESLNMHETIF